MKYVKILLSSIAIVLICANCTVVTPVTVKSSVASWDGTNNNSGFIGWNANGEGIITPHARDRYNALIDIYGKKFTPPLNVDYGITKTTNGFIITNEALANFARMNRWHKTDSVK